MIFHARVCKCVSTLVMSEWPSATFWPLTTNEQGVLAEFVSDLMYLSLNAGMFIRGKCGGVLFKDDIPNTNVLSMYWPFT